MSRAAVYGYARVSSVGQKIYGGGLDVQEAQLRGAGADVVVREAYTGMSADRPVLVELLNKLESGDTLMVTKLDRIARSASKGIELVDSLVGRGIRVWVLNMGVLDNSPAGKMIRNIMFAFAEFERDMIVERTADGRAEAKARKGTEYREGRKPMDRERIERVKALTDNGMSIDAACRAEGIARSTYYKYC